MSVTLDDLATPFVDEMLPWLDREQPPKMGTGVLAENWRRDGYVILPGFLSPQVIDAYADAWIGANADRLMGWPDNCPYMRIGALRRLCCDTDLAQILAFLIGEPMGVHLNLTGWRSTTRDWHQDGYLNPDHVADHYAAVWVALDDIHPDAGPFEYVPGSHRMIPPIRQKPMLRALGTDESNPDWPAESERILTPLFEELIAERELPVRQFIARKGDVLIWHARLLHRGSVPKDPERERRAVISHFSGIEHRPDMPNAVRDQRAGWFFPIHEPGVEQ